MQYTKSKGLNKPTLLAIQTLLQDKTYASDYGVSPENPDNTSSLLAAHQAAVDNEGGVVVLPDGVLKFSGHLDWDIGYVSLFGGKATILDFSEAPDGNVITFNRSYSGNPYKHNMCFWEGFRIVGSGRSGNQTCFFNNTNRYQLRNLNVSEFGIMEEFGEHTYLVTHKNIEGFYCGKIIQFDATVDSGENLRYSDCTFYNSNIFMSLNTPCGFSFNIRFSILPA